MSHPVRVWDLPIRLFHWALAVAVVGLVVTAKVGGGAMVWHFRLGYVVLTLLVFRLVWGFVGGRWARFSHFLYSPARLVRYLRGQSTAQEGEGVGHSPLGALSVFALLGALIAQVTTGLLSDDDIAFSGPLTRFVSRLAVGQATEYHTEIGQYVVMGLVALHVAAIAFHVVVRRKTLIRPMLHGDRQLPAGVPPSRDDATTRVAAAVLLGLCGGFAWWISRL